MSFEVAAKGEAPEHQTALDFSRRAYLTELMDEPCTYEDLHQCLRDLSEVNRVSFGYRPTTTWLKQFAELSSDQFPLHIVDVGCGGGDMLRRIEAWAENKQLAVRLTGIDINSSAIRAAREFTSNSSQIRWLAQDAYSLDVTEEPVDLVISSLFMHHLSDDEILRFIQWMESVSCHGWFINDLYRSATPYSAFRALSKLARWHRFVRHDGPVSFRRAFQPDDWHRYISAAGLPGQQICITPAWPARLCVARRKQP
jgi:SAM-dependent methyltransferase